MRLRSVWISNYKNLRDFTIAFSGEDFIDIFVGKNGSGKSNFLEALIEIFDHLFDFDAGAPAPNFDYTLALERDGRAAQIQWKGSVLSVDGRVRRTRGQMALPENLIIYYSGQNRNVVGLVERYEARFRRRVRSSNLASSPACIGIGPEYKKLLILLLLLLPEDRKARLFLCKKLEILGTRGTFTLRLDRPGFAGRREFDHLDPQDLFWGLQGITLNFLMDLISCIKDGATPGALHNRETDQYILSLDVALFRQVFEERSWYELFNLFNNLKILGMLSDIQMDVTLQGLESSDLSLFSDGQFQSVYLFAIAELFKDRNCITLLDEPDAFLHPEWQFDFLKQTEVISEVAARSNHILMSSHSAATLIPSIQVKVKFFDVQAGIAKCYPLPKKVAIQKLSSNLIKYTEEEQLLSIVNAIQIEQKPVLFTEGSIDPIIIKEAWYRLYERELPFIPFFAFSCSYLKQLLQDDRIIGEMGGRPMFGLFDFDKAYDHWNGMNGEIIQSDWHAGRCKKLAGRLSYAFMLPVPQNATIRRQVLTPSGDSFGGSALCEIEHLFYGDPKTNEFFETEPVPGGGERVILKSDAQKERFAKDVVPRLDNEYFEVFRSMFELVQSLI